MHPDPAAAQIARSALDEASLLARRNRPEEAAAALRRAEQAVQRCEAWPGWSVEIDIVRAMLLYVGGEPAQSIPLLARAREHARLHGLAEAEAHAAALCGLHLIQIERNAEAMEPIAAALQHAPLDSPRGHTARYLAFLALASLCHAAGANERAFALYRRAMDAARAAGDERGAGASISRMAYEQATHALRLHLLGRLDAETLQQAHIGIRSSLQWSERDGLQPFPGDPVCQALLHGIGGDFARADALLTQWRERVVPGVALGLAEMAAALHARTRLAVGDADGARRLAAQAQDSAQGLADALSRAFVQHQAAAVFRGLSDARAERAEAAARAELAQAEQERERQRAALDALLGDGPLAALVAAR